MSILALDLDDSEHSCFCAHEQLLLVNDLSLNQPIDLFVSWYILNTYGSQHLLSNLQDLEDPSDFWTLQIFGSRFVFWPCLETIWYLGCTLFFSVAFSPCEGNPVIGVSLFHSLNWMIKPLHKYIYICTWMLLFFLLYRKLITRT